MQLLPNLYAPSCLVSTPSCIPPDYPGRLNHADRKVTVVIKGGREMGQVIAKEERERIIAALRATLEERGLTKQDQVIAFAKSAVAVEIPQQALSKILRGKLLNPKNSAHAVALLLALGLNANGEKMSKPVTSPSDAEALETALEMVEAEYQAKGSTSPNTAERARVILLAHDLLKENVSRAVVLQFVRRAVSK